MFRKLISITTVILVIFAYMPSVAFAGETDGQGFDVQQAAEEIDQIDADAGNETDADADADADNSADSDEEDAASGAIGGAIHVAKATQQKIKTTSEKVRKTVAEMGDSSKWTLGTEFMAIGLTRLDSFSESKVDKYCQNLVTKLDKNKSATINERQASDNAKAILALTSMGVDPTNVYGYNLLEPLSDMNYVSKQGINGIIWTLIAVNSYGYDIPENEDPSVQTTTDKLVQALLSGRNSDGGWSYSGTRSDVDITSMALQALASYYGNDANVTAAVNEAVSWLSDNQDENGNFSTVGNVNSESSSQVIVALCALGIDPNTDERFIKNGKSAIDSLLSFYTSAGFKHIYSESGRNGLATTQGNYALAAYLRFVEGKTSLYDMSDIESLKVTEAKPGESGDDPEEKAESKTVTKSIDLKLDLSGAAKDVIELVKKAVATGDEDIAKNAYSAYLELSAAERLAVRKDDSWKAYQELVSVFGDKNHKDEAAGVDLTQSTSTALPWYIVLVVTDEYLTDNQETKIQTELGEGSAVLTTYDISFINSLTGEEWHPKKIIRVRLRISDLGNLENAVVYHIGGDGNIEFLAGEMADGNMEFSAIDFSIYGIAGMNGTFSDLLTADDLQAEDEGHGSILPWILLGIAALALILFLIILISRKKNRGETDE